MGTESSEDEASGDEASTASSEYEAPTEASEDEASEDEASTESCPSFFLNDNDFTRLSEPMITEDEQATPKSGSDIAKDNSKSPFFTVKWALEQGWVGVGNPNECLPLSQHRYPTRCYFEKAPKEVTRKIGRSTLLGVREDESS